jgi:gamma-glutamyl:cysteine ligase YbdK (ATP-grasp superfamily)
MTYRYELGLFDGFGVELEYMLVDRETLDVRPVADALIGAAAGIPAAEIERGEMAWSNELALHLIEFKTNGPAARLEDLTPRFQQSVTDANALLEPLGARLMPGGMHPWMDPEKELLLWPHEYGSVYRSFDRIFGCRGHGWANVQSAHLNLPFADDAEFGRLHAALRVVLPILPALAASSPIVAARRTGLRDNRLDCYRRNTERIPSVTADVVPEPIFTRESYERDVLERIYRDLAPHDPQGVLRHEWVNARGAIARFDRGAIEIRVLDVQECPGADLAIAAAAVAAIEALVDEEWCGAADQRSFDTASLSRILQRTTARADEALIGDGDYLRLLGHRGDAAVSARDLWRHLIESTLARDPAYATWSAALEVLLEEGSLSSRILRRLGPDPARDRLRDLYGELCGCLVEGRLLRGRR